MGGTALAEDAGKRLGKGSAAELLAAWRGAERDRAAAEATASVAALASAAATEAQTAASETATAARLSLEAAQKAEHAAHRTADAAGIVASTTRQEFSDAEAALQESRSAENIARDTFLGAQKQGFPKDGGAGG